MKIVNIFIKQLTRLQIYILTVILFIVLTSHIAIGRNEQFMDVVILMDSSGSMKKNDPKILRVPAAKMFVSLLSKNDRVSIVSFSDEGYPILQLTKLGTKKSMAKIHHAIDKVSSKGAYTNIYSALQKGHQLLSDEKIAGPNLKIMLIMSDGQMDVGNSNKDIELTGKLRIMLTEKIKKEKIKVYTIAFTEESDKKLLEEIAQKSDGVFNFAQNDKELHHIFTSIFENLKQPEMIPFSGNSFLIDDSITEVTIVGTKEKAKTEITLQSPSNKEYTSKTKNKKINWFKTPGFDMVTIQNPIPGKWQIHFSTGKNNKAYIATNLKLSSALESSSLIVGKATTIVAWLEKDKKRIDKAEILKNVDISIILSKPDGTIQTIKSIQNISDERKIEKLGLAKFSVTPDIEGDYKIKIVAKGKTFGRETTHTLKAILPANYNLKKTIQEKKLPAKKMSIEPAPIEVEIPWISVIIKFLAINFIIAAILILYIKKKDSNFTILRKPLKRDKSNDKN